MKFTWQLLLSQIVTTIVVIFFISRIPFFANLMNGGNNNQ